MKKSRYTDGQIIFILKQAESRTPVPELCPEQRDLLQVACKIRRHGRFIDCTHEGPDLSCRMSQSDGCGRTQVKEVGIPQS